MRPLRVESPHAVAVGCPSAVAWCGTRSQPAAGPHPGATDFPADEQDEHGRSVAWSDRIIFPPIELDALSTRRGDDEEDDDGSASIDVPVERI
jgi:hypothetical protein